ncbi:MAG: neutral zinc metallopeptidase [Candidatus Electrothrix sp. GW3-4]|uniref:KPN_02809 family neutral zinc metallopeptidase n=1 Tax=Candidatus Electrothrix sp. GW3-4 TaxID=3126740 RepID=UPI0030D5D6CC
MRWQGRRKSENIEDRRNMRVSGAGGFGNNSSMLRLLPMAVKFLGFKGTVIAVLCLGAYGLFSGNLGSMLALLGLQQGPSISTSRGPVQETGAEKELVDFISVILADTETTWSALFQQKGKAYQEPHLVLFRDAVKSACGLAQSATGPFYCPGDQQVYIDLSFFDELKNRFKAPGDFAQAYVITHEIGHHVQKLLGISDKVHSARKKVGKRESNQLSVLQELQADCFAGVWAYHNQDMLEAGDVEEGLAAASAIGDDRLQKQAKGYVSPDSFTHGSSAQRVQWFKTGLTSGRMESCNTFRKN